MPQFGLPGGAVRAGSAPSEYPVLCAPSASFAGASPCLGHIVFQELCVSLPSERGALPPQPRCRRRLCKAPNGAGQENAVARQGAPEAGPSRQCAPAWRTASRAGAPKPAHPAPPPSRAWRSTIWSFFSTVVGINECFASSATKQMYFGERDDCSCDCSYAVHKPRVHQGEQAHSRSPGGRSQSKERPKVWREKAQNPHL